MAGPAYGNAKHELVHGPEIVDAEASTRAAAGAAPTDLEFEGLVTDYNTLVVKFNALLAACRSANIIA
jgi:hypothetical protein